MLDKVKKHEGKFIEKDGAKYFVDISVFRCYKVLGLREDGSYDLIELFRFMPDKNGEPQLYSKDFKDTELIDLAYNIIYEYLKDNLLIR